MMDAYRPNYDWQPEDEDCVRSMWLAGEPARAISKALKGKVSRSAVVAKAHRLGLKGAPRAPRAVRTPRAVFLTSPPLVPEHFRPVPFVSRSSDQCAWIEGNPKAVSHDEVMCCGLRVKPGKSWCPEHYSRVYLRPKREEPGA